MKKLLLIAVLASSAQANPKFNLKDYKTVSVQPVLGARGTVSGDLAALASTGEATPNPKFAQARAAVTDGKGFGFAGKATRADMAMLGLGSVTGMLPATMKLDAAHLKDQVAQARAGLAKLGDKLDPRAVAAFTAALDSADNQDFTGTMKLLVDAMMTTVEGITKGKERVHAYTAIGLYFGLCTVWTAMGKQSTAFASLAEPLERMLEEDALMGGMDRAVSAQLKVVAETVGSAQPSLDKVAQAMTSLRDLKPD